MRLRALGCLLLLIGTLASVAIPRGVTSWRLRERAAANRLADQIAVAQERYHDRKGRFAPTLTMLAEQRLLGRHFGDGQFGCVYFLGADRHSWSLKVFRPEEPSWRPIQRSGRRGLFQGGMSGLVFFRPGSSVSFSSSAWISSGPVLGN
jgi:hypothetical protein